MADFFDKISHPDKLKGIAEENLPLVAEELRNKIIDTVSHTGGHLASSLGAVELAIALHYCLNTPKDKIVWDVGHQAYAHKLLTERFKKFHTLRQYKGISGFPNKNESKFDCFTTGHSSTAVSLALGLAVARDIKKQNEKVIAVIGDGSLSGGLCFEALNNAGHLKRDMMVILNSNEMAISKAVGALSVYMNKIISAPIYNRLRREFDEFLSRIPKIGRIAHAMNRRFDEVVKSLLVPGILFEELGFRYFGPLDGHNLEVLIPTLKNIINLKGPILFHVVTQKGKGFKPAEENPEKFHGTGPFVISNGNPKKSIKPSEKTYTQVFSETITDLARKNNNLVTITAAMPSGTGLVKFAEEFPGRFFDVGIAEEHAVAFSAGLAKKGVKPVAAIYSSFLQRAYDQIIEELALQDANVFLALDRAGIVGEDGATHHGVFDIAYLKSIPNIVIMAPRDAEEFRKMLVFGVDYNRGPIAVRYPRGKVPEIKWQNNTDIKLGKAEVLKEGQDNLIIALGSMVASCFKAAEMLMQKHKISSSLVNARFAKPLDKDLFSGLIKKHKNIFIFEEAAQNGSFASSFLQELSEVIHESKSNIKFLGVPDKFIEHGKREILLQQLNLHPEGIAEFILGNIHG